jgi:hypothetical protein
MRNIRVLYNSHSTSSLQLNLRSQAYFDDTQPHHQLLALAVRRHSIVPPLVVLDGQDVPHNALHVTATDGAALVRRHEGDKPGQGRLVSHGLRSPASLSHNSHDASDSDPEARPQHLQQEALANRPAVDPSVAAARLRLAGGELLHPLQSERYRRRVAHLLTDALVGPVSAAIAGDTDVAALAGPLGAALAALVRLPRSQGEEGGAAAPAAAGSKALAAFVIAEAKLHHHGRIRNPALEAKVGGFIRMFVYRKHHASLPYYFCSLRAPRVGCKRSLCSCPPCPQCCGNGANYAACSRNSFGGRSVRPRLLLLLLLLLTGADCMPLRQQKGPPYPPRSMLRRWQRQWIYVNHPGLSAACIHSSTKTTDPYSSSRLKWIVGGRCLLRPCAWQILKPPS